MCTCVCACVRVCELSQVDTGTQEEQSSLFLRVTPAWLQFNWTDRQEQAATTHLLCPCVSGCVCVCVCTSVSVCESESVWVCVGLRLAKIKERSGISYSSPLDHEACLLSQLPVCPPASLITCLSLTSVYLSICLLADDAPLPRTLRLRIAAMTFRKWDHRSSCFWG